MPATKRSVIDVRALLLDAPIVPHRHLTEVAGRKLFKAMRDDMTGRTARRVREVATAIAAQDVKAKAFAALLPCMIGKSSRAERRGR